MSSQNLRRYRIYRAEGLPAQVALRAARPEPVTTPYPFLEDLDYNKAVSGTVASVQIKVWVEADDEAYLGEDDVTGTFTDKPGPDHVRNTTSGVNGNGFKFYRPSNYVRTYAYADYRSQGMSKSVARDAVRERIQTEMRADAAREFYGVCVTAHVAQVELARESLWGVDADPDDTAYLLTVAAELIGEALTAASAALPAALVKALDTAGTLARALPTAG